MLALWALSNTKHLAVAAMPGDTEDKLEALRKQMEELEKAEEEE